jgi:hypothetical protein
MIPSRYILVLDILVLAVAAAHDIGRNRASDVRYIMT